VKVLRAGVAELPRQRRASSRSVAGALVTEEEAGRRLDDEGAVAR
jgi:hypothetical protein